MGSHILSSVLRVGVVCFIFVRPTNWLNACDCNQGCANNTRKVTWVKKKLNKKNWNCCTRGLTVSELNYNPPSPLVKKKKKRSVVTAEFCHELWLLTKKNGINTAVGDPKVYTHVVYFLPPSGFTPHLCVFLSRRKVRLAKNRLFYVCCCVWMWGLSCVQRWRVYQASGWPSSRTLTCWQKWCR